MWETLVLSLGWEDPLEKEMAMHSSILAWRIPWIKELGGLLVHGVTKSRTRQLTLTWLWQGSHIPFPSSREGKTLPSQGLTAL